MHIKNSTIHLFQMKIKRLLYAISLACLSLFSCEDGSYLPGDSLLRGDVSIEIDSTFVVTGRSIEYTTINSKSMTQLLGHLSVPEYGDLDCSFVSQLMAAGSLGIPDSIPTENVDSMRVRFRFANTAFTGDSLAPQQLKIYQLTKQLPSDIDNNFEAHYINIRGKGDVIRQLKKEAKAANKVFLATDPDREGEAISWHLAELLKLDPKKTSRVTFNEITKPAITEAVKHPRDIDMDLVNAQQARRILDRIVGYQISPILWKTVKSGLSAGRVQSVATKIIVDREEEIRAFVPDEYWTIDATLATLDNKEFNVRFYGNKRGRVKLNSQEDAKKVLEKNAAVEAEFNK